MKLLFFAGPLSVLLLAATAASAQTSIPPAILVRDSITQSDFEAAMGVPGAPVSQMTFWSQPLRNLELSPIVMVTGNDTVRRAWQFMVRPRDGNIRLIPYRDVSFLDEDEVPALLEFMNSALKMDSTRKSRSRNRDEVIMLGYQSRGGIVGMARLKGRRFDFALMGRNHSYTMHVNLNHVQMIQFRNLLMAGISRNKISVEVYQPRNWDY